jgi:ERCC4-related helicase
MKFFEFLIFFVNFCYILNCADNKRISVNLTKAFIKINKQLYENLLGIAKSKLNPAKKQKACKIKENNGEQTVTFTEIKYICIEEDDDDGTHLPFFIVLTVGNLDIEVKLVKNQSKSVFDVFDDPFIFTFEDQEKKLDVFLIFANDYNTEAVKNLLRIKRKDKTTPKDSYSYFDEDFGINIDPNYVSNISLTTLDQSKQTSNNSESRIASVIPTSIIYINK